MPAATAVMMPMELLMPEMDCESHIGNDLYQFYFPIEIGDFVVNLWTKMGLDFSITIYENGSSISRRDPRFMRKTWSKKLFNTWREETFNKRELDEILTDLFQMSN
jgi:hypothetical protein